MNDRAYSPTWVGWQTIKRMSKGASWPGPPNGKYTIMCGLKQLLLVLCPLPLEGVALKKSSEHAAVQGLHRTGVVRRRLPLQR